MSSLYLQKLTEKFGFQFKLVDVGGGVIYLTHSPAANIMENFPLSIIHTRCSSLILARPSASCSAGLVSR